MPISYIHNGRGKQKLSTARFWLEWNTLRWGIAWKGMNLVYSGKSRALFQHIRPETSINCPREIGRQ